MHYALCGTGSETDEYWICHWCGNKFQAGEYESELDNKICRVENLKMQIAVLTDSLHGEPADLSGKVQVAEKVFNNAKENHSKYEEEFVATSDMLKFMKKFF